MSERISTAELARRVGVTPETLKRWVAKGVVPKAPDEDWTPATIAHARVVARLRERGHSLEEIKAAGEDGRLAFSMIEDLLPRSRADRSIEEAAEVTGLEPALIERILATAGFTTTQVQHLGEDDVDLLRHAAGALRAGFPLVAFLQLLRVYGQALAQIADAEVHLFHLYVHEPLMRDGVPGLDMAQEMQTLAGELLPLAGPVMDALHRRFLHHFVEQDVIGHMETDLGEGMLDLGRLRVAIAFADLAGYTRLTEEAGEEEAIGAVERFVEAVEKTLPDDARVIKTIGDEVMVVGHDPGAVTDWAVQFQQTFTHRPRPRIGIHYGEALYRDGDYYGRDVNLASRVAARAAGGEVIVTRPVVEAAHAHLEFELIGEVRLKGFSDPTELFIARAIEPDER